MGGTKFVRLMRSCENPVRTYSLRAPSGMGRDDPLVIVGRRGIAVRVVEFVRVASMELVLTLKLLSGLWCPAALRIQLEASLVSHSTRPILVVVGCLYLTHYRTSSAAHRTSPYTCSP